MKRGSVTHLCNLRGYLVLRSDGVHLYRDFVSLSLDVKKGVSLGAFRLVRLTEAGGEAVVVVDGFGLGASHTLLVLLRDIFGGPIAAMRRSRGLTIWKSRASSSSPNISTALAFRRHWAFCRWFCSVSAFCWRVWIDFAIISRHIWLRTSIAFTPLLLGKGGGAERMSSTVGSWFRFLA